MILSVPDWIFWTAAAVLAVAGLLTLDRRVTDWGTGDQDHRIGQVRR